MSIPLTSLIRTFLILLVAFASALVASPVQAQNGFITTWKTDNFGNSDDDQISIPIFGLGYDFTVDWGDGTTTTWQDGDNPGELVHTYASVGTYTVGIGGNFPRILSTATGDQQKILSIEQWGDIEWVTMEGAFQGAINLQLNATDAPNLSGVTSLAAMFADALPVNSDLNHWDVSNVTDMSSMFHNADAFNGDISDWDVSGVADMNGMFLHAATFNVDIGDWDVSSVEDMSGMFYAAEAFNQNIGGWDVSSVQHMTEMFLGASAFNQDISAWDISNVGSMIRMFNGASVFDQDLGSWNVTGFASMVGMLDDSGFSTANYDATLIGWEPQTVFGSVELGAMGLTYCAGADARQSLIDDYNWTISGDELDPSCPLADEASPDEIVDGLTEPRPNPASGSTSLTLRVADAEHVSVEIFDALGRRVQTLYDGVLAAGMTETLTLDVSLLPAGVYTIRAVGEAPGSGAGTGFAKSRRVTVLR